MPQIPQITRLSQQLFNSAMLLLKKYTRLNVNITILIPDLQHPKTPSIYAKDICPPIVQLASKSHTWAKIIARELSGDAHFTAQAHPEPAKPQSATPQSGLAQIVKNLTRGANVLTIECLSYDEAMLKPFEILDSTDILLIAFTPNTYKQTLFWYFSSFLYGKKAFVIAPEPKNNQHLTTTLSKYLLAKTLKSFFQLNSREFHNILKRTIQESVLQKHAQLFKHGSVAVEDFEISYHTLLHADHENHNTIIFFHGFLARSLTYKNMLKLLHKRGFNIIAIDLPYHGDSINKSLKNIDAHFRSLETVLTPAIKSIPIVLNNEHISTTHNQSPHLYIMGHSLGGATAFLAKTNEKELGLNFARTFLLNPAGGPITQNKAKLVYLTTLYRLTNQEEYKRLGTELKKIVLDIIFNQIRNIFKQTRLEHILRLSDLIPQGFQNFDNMYIDGLTTLVFTHEDAYFNKEYQLNFLKHTGYTRFITFEGAHDWPVTHPERILKVLDT